jgi:hypothetical protein
VYDQTLTHQMSALAEEVSAAAWLAPAAKVRSRGDRRRIQVAGVAAIVAGVLTATIGAVMATGGGVLTSDTGRAKTIPDAFVLPHERDPGWDRDDNPRIASVFNPCGGEDPTLADRTDARTVSGVLRQVADPAVTYQLFLFRNDRAALAAITELSRKAAAECGWYGGWTPTMGLGRYVVHANNGSEVSPRLRREAVAVRRDNVIYVAYGETDDFSHGSFLFDYPALLELARSLCGVLRLCEPLTCYAIPAVGEPIGYRTVTPGPEPSYSPGGVEPSPGSSPQGPIVVPVYPTQPPIEAWKPFPCDQDPSDSASSGPPEPTGS